MPELRAIIWKYVGKEMGVPDLNIGYHQERGSVDVYDGGKMLL